MLSIRPLLFGLLWIMFYGITATTHFAPITEKEASMNFIGAAVILYAIVAALCCCCLGGTVCMGRWIAAKRRTNKKKKNEKKLKRRNANSSMIWKIGDSAPLSVAVDVDAVDVDAVDVDADLNYLENFLEEYQKKSMNQLQECKSAAFSKAHQKLAVSMKEDVLREELMLLPKDLSSIWKNETVNVCKDEEMKDFGGIKPMMNQAPSAVVSLPFMSPRSELTSPAFMSPRSQFLSPSQSEMSRRQTPSELRLASRITSPKSSEFMSASSEAHEAQDKD